MANSSAAPLAPSRKASKAFTTASEVIKSALNTSFSTPIKLAKLSANSSIAIA